MKLVIDNVSKNFIDPQGKQLSVLENVSLTVHSEEFVALVGPSGCGKSTLLNLTAGLLSPSDGSIYFTDLTEGHTPAMGIVFQETGLFPWRSVYENIAFGLEATGVPKTAQKERIQHYINLVGLGGFEKAFPHQLSGGMRQRVVIAIAAACRPQVLICDEPTTALDVTIQAQILQLIRDLQKELGMSVIYITHDLGVVANVADRVAVMYAGQIVEYGTVEEIFYDAWHPYTWALLQALPQLGTKGEALPSVDGTPPNLFNEIKGDAFAPRNKHALAIDFVQEPPFFQVSETHAAKTWYLDPRAPKIERPHSIQNLREKMGKMGGANLNG